jgi:hypothetical protein
MSIILALVFGGVFGAMVGVAWRNDEYESLLKANTQLIEERDRERAVKRMFHPAPRPVKL